MPEQRRKPHVRRKLRINEVSLCGDPANPFARIAFHKAQDEDRTMVIPLEKHIPDDETGIDLAELSEDVQDKILKVLDEAGYDVDAEAIDTSGMSGAAAEAVEKLVKRTKELEEKKQRQEKRIVELKAEAETAKGNVNGVNSEAAVKAALEVLRKKTPTEVGEALSEIGKDNGGTMPKKCQPVTRAILYTVAKMRGQELYPDVHPDIARAVFLTETPEGQKLQKAMEGMLGSWIEPDTAPLEKSAGEQFEELPAFQKLTKLAAEGRIADPSLTREQSFAAVHKDNPGLANQERAERAALKKKLVAGTGEE